MTRTDRQRLIAAAVEARRNAVAPYSHFKVGAALLSATGDIFSGVNIESASFGLTCCAERVALFKALSEGQTTFTAIAVVAEVTGGPMLCGACRQLLFEYATEATVWVADSRKPRIVKRFSVRGLLPDGFRMAGASSAPRRRVR